MREFHLWCRRCCIAVTAIAPFLAIAYAQPQTGSADWRWTGKIYLWASGINGTLRNGGEIDVGFDDLLENLELALMGGVEASNGTWSVIGDVIYMNLAGEGTSSLPGPGPVEIQAKAGLEGWVVNLLGAYRFASSPGGSVDLTFGARYLDLDVQLDAITTLPRPGRSVRAGDSVVDAVVGFRGGLRLSETWYVPYLVDVGAGESDLTWQAMAGIGWQPSWGEITLFYRFLEWDFDSSSALDDIGFSGPGLLFKYHFN